jgi:hypothetical protein
MMSETNGQASRWPIRICGFALVLLLILDLSACGAEDNSFNLELKNNMSMPVVVMICNGYGSCASVVYRTILKSGEYLPTAQEADGISRPVQVRSLSGRTIGCLPFRFSRVPPATAVVTLSGAVPCGSSLGIKEAHGRDWPYSQF